MKWVKPNFPESDFLTFDAKILFTTRAYEWYTNSIQLEKGSTMMVNFVSPERSQQAGARVNKELSLVPRRCIIDLISYWATLVGQRMHISYSCKV